MTSMPTDNQTDDPDTESPAEATIGYAAALDELQDILDELEVDTPDVDQLADRVARASVLIGVCRDRIGSARLEVERVVADLESPRPLDDSLSAD